MSGDLRILVTIPQGEIRNSFITPEIEKKINSLGEVEWNTGLDQFTSENLRDRLEDKDICITGWGCERFGKDVLIKANHLRMIAHTGGSVAGLVSDEMYDRGIRIVSANACYAESVAEGVIAYILAALRDIPFWDSLVKSGGWKPIAYHNEGILDKTIGLVGFGATTKFLLNMLKPFRVKVKVYSNHLCEKEAAGYSVHLASLDEIFSTCNIISLHASQRPETYHMVNERLLQKIPKGALLINTARGSIIDEKALIKELEKGRFKAVLDVYEIEPLPPESPLRILKNAILIPHMAGPTIDRRVFSTKMILDEIDRFIKGQVLKHEISRSYASHMTQ